MLEYSEPGMCFAGKVEFTYGSGMVSICEEQWDYHEGLYFMRPDEWMDMELDFLIRNAIENGVPLADFQEQYNFLSDDDMNTLVEKYTTL